MKYYYFHKKTEAQRSVVFKQIHLASVSWQLYSKSFTFKSSLSGIGGAVYLGTNGILQVGQDERIGGRSNHGLLQECFCKGNNKGRLSGYNFSGFSPPILPSFLTQDLLGWECPRWLLWERISSCWLPTGSHSIAPSRLAKWLASSSLPSWFHSEKGPVAVSSEVEKTKLRKGERRFWRKEQRRAELNETDIGKFTGGWGSRKKKMGKRTRKGFCQVPSSWIILPSTGEGGKGLSLFRLPN